MNEKIIKLIDILADIFDELRNHGCAGQNFFDTLVYQELISTLIFTNTVMQKAQVMSISPRRARRIRKDKSKLMCFPFVIFVIFVIFVVR